MARFKSNAYARAAGRTARAAADVPSPVDGIGVIEEESPGHQTADVVPAHIAREDATHVRSTRPGRARAARRPPPYGVHRRHARSTAPATAPFRHGARPPLPRHTARAARPGLDRPAVRPTTSATFHYRGSRPGLEDYTRGWAPALQISFPPGRDAVDPQVLGHYSGDQGASTEDTGMPVRVRRRHRRLQPTAASLDGVHQPRCRR